ncbi:MAG: response regulator [Firmicutes bacterium]|nr:response regulator [Bacillota bacterium]
MRDKKGLILSALLGTVLVYSNVSYLTDFFKIHKTLNYLMIFLIFIISILLFISYLKKGNKGLNSKDKLFNSLIHKSDTVYIMINCKNKKVVYLSEKVEDILGIKTSDKSDEDIVYQILNIPMIKNELNNWDKITEYVSQMIEYDNPKYNHKMWIKIKIYPYKEKNEEYFIIQVLDATKEHDRQHLLISQATDIKARESTLNQITAKSYDLEMNINLTLNSYELKYFKKDKLYFGEEKRGKYTEELENILNYINEKDRDLVYSNLNIEFLKDRFSKYELDSIAIRYRLGNKVKNNIWLESTIFFITNRQKNVVSILTKNVTESAESIREQNVMLQNALNDAKLLDKSKTELISTISHEIRTPLTNIVGLSDALLNEKLEDNIREDIKNINDSSNEMIHIIDGLLDTSKIEKRLIEKNEKQYSILKLLKKIEDSAKEYIGDKSIKLNLNLDNNLPVILFGDSRRITGALNEIINNSIKNTDEGVIDINVRGEKINNEINLIVEVIDTGSGIDEEKLNSIMTKETNKGLGSVKSLMELLDGKLEIESKVGEFTKVTISFMQKIVEDNKIRKMMNNNKNAEEFSLKGKKVLIVDDNKLNLKVTNRLLNSYDLDITLLESGQECIDFIKEQNNFDLILMDQMMPGLDGISTMNKLKEIENFDTPIVVLTADAMQGQKEKYISDGFDDYISKPIDKSELSRVLKKFLKDQ